MSPVTATFTGGGLAALEPPEAGGVGLLSPGSGERAGPGEVVLRTTRPPLALRVKLGATSAKLSGGVGGWETVDRPGRQDALEWKSLPLRVLEIPLLFDGLARGRTIDTELTVLYAMGRPAANSPRGTPPPTIRLGGMVPHGDRDWVLTDIEAGETIWDGRHRLRAWVTITLTELETLELIKVGAKASSTPTTRTHTVRAGESLGTIARDQMGAKSASAIAKAVAELKRLNGIRDAKSLRPGQRIKVPRA